MLLHNIDKAKKWSKIYKKLSTCTIQTKFGVKQILYVHVTKYLKDTNRHKISGCDTQCTLNLLMIDN